MAHVEVKEDSLTGKEITFLYQIQPGTSPLRAGRR